MTKIEAREFIEKMQEIGDIWEMDEVMSVYGEDSLQKALESRMGELGIMANIIATVLNRKE